MSESTLTVAFQELQAEIGGYLGYGKGTNFGDIAWDTRKQGIIDSLTKKGLRRFYFSAKLPNDPTNHDWSFLHPEASLAFASGSQTIPLPDDFRGLSRDGEISATTEVFQPWPVRIVSDGFIRQRYNDWPSVTGRPEFAAVKPIKGTGPTQGQRFELFLYPQAEQDYTIYFNYELAPDCLTGALPFCYGGPQHSGTILQACLAAAERDLDNIGNGPNEQHYLMLLDASIAADRDLKAGFLGRNENNSDNRGDFRRRSSYQGQYSYFTGVTYGTQ